MSLYSTNANSFPLPLSIYHTSSMKQSFYKTNALFPTNLSGIS